MSDLDLTPEQDAIVHSWGKGQAVLAGAGCGKTTTLVQKCKALLRKNPEAHFAAVSFTERSANDLRKKLAEQLPSGERGGPLYGHWVMTIHGLCAAIIKEFPTEAGIDGDEFILTEPEAHALWQESMDRLWYADFSEEVEGSLEFLLARESRSSLSDLLWRMKSLESFGAIEILRESQEEDSRHLSVLGAYVLNHYHRAKVRRGVLDFDDLEKRADRAVQHERVKKFFHQKFDLIMIDEFQDTNSVQARLIWNLARPDQSNLCVVGDPKQSIYRFRDADVSVFEERSASLPLNQVLSWNFRSRPGVIEFTNQVCEPPFAASAFRYDPLVAKREASEQYDPVTRFDVTHPSELARWILSEIESGLELSDMALLLRKIRGNERWLMALKAAKIPIAIGSGGLFWEDARVRELTHLLHWWYLPHQSFSGAVFMRAPWAGVKDEDLDAWMAQGPFLGDSFFASNYSLARILKPLRERREKSPGSIRPAEILESLLNAHDLEIEEELSVAILGLWHRAEELSSAGKRSEEVVLEFMRALRSKRRESDLPPPKNRGQLTILTVHGSKGLEFPHVILVDFKPKKERARPAPLLFWNRVKGAFLGRRTEDGDRDQKNAIEAQWKLLEKESEIAESKRLFYVALTRAKERLLLFCDQTDELKLDAEADLSADFWRAWMEAASLPHCKELELPLTPPAIVFPESEKDLTPISELRATFVAERQRARHSVTEWNTLAKCARAYELTYIHPVFQPQERSRFQDSVGISPLTAAELGTKVHACIDAYAKDGDPHPFYQLQEEVGESIFTADPLVQWLMTSSLMKTPEGSHAYSELAFEVPVGTREEVLVGAIDRLQVEGDEYTLIDFKMTHQQRSPQHLFDEYRNQMNLYAWAIDQLEPPNSTRKWRAFLINIFPGGVSELEVHLERPPVEEWIDQANSIMNGMTQPEKCTSPKCRFCREKLKQGVIDDDILTLKF